MIAPLLLALLLLFLAVTARLSRFHFREAVHYATVANVMEECLELGKGRDDTELLDLLVKRLYDDNVARFEVNNSMSVWQTLRDGGRL